MTRVLRPARSLRSKLERARQGALPQGALRDIVLLGGGHAHVQVLKAFGMRPQPGLRLTIVAREAHSPYSGMLPGFVAGWYEWDDLHIDLARLAAFAGVRFVAAEATGLDLAAGCVRLAGRPSMRFDALSINTGGTVGGLPASDFVTPVKPIGRFLPAWQRLIEEGPPKHLTVVGGGAGGVELALAITHRHPSVRCALVEAAPTLLGGLSGGMRRRLLAALRGRQVEVLEGFRVTSAEGDRVWAEDGREVATEHVLSATGVLAPMWAADAGIAVDAAGFIEVDATLRSTSHPNVFAAGDVAAARGGSGAPLPKSGVYAVRQGPVLAANLRAVATGRRPRRYRPQRRTLAIVGLGDGRAVGGRGAWHADGAWMWRWKQRLDRRFMARFNELPAMPAPSPSVPAALRSEAPEPMRCGGCGAKLGADMLRRVLHRLDVHTSPATVRGIGDDAALVRVETREVAVSCDGFRAVIDDVYRFGRIAAHHALNDLFAFGARPRFALALATVPAMADAMMEEDLYQLMSGALAVLGEHAVDLVGGHSAEGAELGLAFSVTGTMTGRAWTKGGLSPGEKLVLTKPVGTGAVLAGAMRGLTRASELLATVDAMDTSNAAAAEALRAHGASACTDVTGFGLVGHLAEMTRASEVGVRVRARDVPLLPGAARLIEAGVVSSLQASNELAFADFTVRGGSPAGASARVLADPQTAGGLLAGLRSDRVPDCLAQLARCGHPRVAVVGEVLPRTLEIDLS